MRANIAQERHTAVGRLANHGLHASEDLEGGREGGQVDGQEALGRKGGEGGGKIIPAHLPRRVGGLRTRCQSRWG